MPTVTPNYPGPYNTYVPTAEASQSLLVGYSRNPKSFRVSEYTQYIMAEKMTGLYRVWTSQQGSRILTNSDNEHVWAAGAAMPDGSHNTESSTLPSFRTVRRLFNVTLDDLSIEQADWPLLAAHAQEQAQLAMTSRTLRVYNALKTAAWGSNTGVVNNGILPNNQTWANGTPDSVYTAGNYVTGPNIKVSLQFANAQIVNATYGAVDPSAMSLVIGYQLAQAMAASAEIQNFLKQSPYALPQLRGDVPAQNGKWGLPDTLYDTDVEVEKTIRISSRQNASVTVQGPVFPKTEAYLLAREGELEGIEGARNFSTLQIFFYKDEMTLKNIYDPWNERQMLGVVTNDSPVVVSAVSGFQFTGCQ